MIYDFIISGEWRCLQIWGTTGGLVMTRSIQSAFFGTPIRILIEWDPYCSCCLTAWHKTWLNWHTHTNMSWLCWLAQTRQICIEYSPKWLVNIWGMGSESWYGSNSFAEFLISCWASKLLWSPVAWPRTLDWVAPTQSSRSFWRTPSGMTWLKVVSRWLRMTPMTPQFLVLKC